MTALETHRLWYARLSCALGGAGDVRSLRRGTPPDDTCWCAGKGWWLSIAPPA